jgi:hypothetical protein
VLASVLAVVTACVFASNIQSAEDASYSAGHRVPPRTFSSKPGSHKADGTRQTHNILIQEADLQKMRTSSIYIAK